MNRNLFDSSAQGIIRYFIRPNDCYVTNSLELLNVDEYTYRLLRHEGYQRVLFFQTVRSANRAKYDFEIYTFDRLSALSYTYPEEFAKVDLNDSESVKKFFVKVEKIKSKSDQPLPGIKVAIPRKKEENGKPPAQFGKMVVDGKISGVDLLNSTFANKLKLALTAKNIRTAVVMPLDLINEVIINELDEVQRGKKLSFEPSAVTQSIRQVIDHIQDDYNISSILIFTMQYEKSLNEFFKKSYLKVLCPFIDWLGPENQNSDGLLSELKERGIIVNSGNVGIDEIFNLLLRKKIIEKCPEMDALDVSKIYPLAERIKCHITQKKRYFESIPFENTKRDDPIVGLIKRLKEKAFLSEMMGKAKLCKPSFIRTVNSLDNLYVERIAHTFQKRYEEIGHNPFEKLDRLIGLKEPKKNVKKIANRIKHPAGGKKAKIEPGHYMFVGNPGTGKTEVARLMGEILHNINALTKGHCVEVDRSKLVADHIGGTERKTKAYCKQALGGVLFVDEAYTLYNKDSVNDFGHEALEVIMKFMEDHRRDLCVIFAGYQDKMTDMMNANQGIVSRISDTIEFPDYTADELTDILKLMGEERGYELTDEFVGASRSLFGQWVKSKTEEFGNAREVRKFLDRADGRRASRIAELEATGHVVTDDDNNKFIAADANEQTAQNVTDPFEKLDRLIGLHQVKKTIRSISNQIKFSPQKADLEPGHYMFVGNPGTGKTEVARLMGEILHNIGALSKGRCVEVDRSKLIGKYIGHTEAQTERYCKEALGGVLFVDEAYTLVDGSNSDFGMKALDTIMKFMEDHRRDLCVIFAGYQDKLQRVINANPGIDSRISDVITFPDYTSNELADILKLMAESDGFVLSEGFIRKARYIFKKWVDNKPANFGNAREVRKFLRKAKQARADRLALEESDGKEIGCATNTMLLPEDAGFAREDCRDERGRYKKVSRTIFDCMPIIDNFKKYDSSASETKRRNLIRDSILFVKTDIDTGTAFLISPDGYALTCNHVVKGATNIVARSRIEKRQGNRDMEHKCEVINAKEDIDIALIKLEGRNFPYLPLADESREILDGESFTLCGYPLGRSEDMTSYTGKIANQNGIKDQAGIAFRYIEGEAKKGNSGSPLVAHSDGKVIGILFGSDIDQHDEMNKMRPISYFWEEFLK